MNIVYSHRDYVSPAGSVTPDVVFVSHADASAYLGRDYDGSETDDGTLIAALTADSVLEKIAEGMVADLERGKAPSGILDIARDVAAGRHIFGSSTRSDEEGIYFCYRLNVSD